MDTATHTPATDRPLRCSVLIPVLDEERDIARAVSAMQAQTVRDIELIFADGGSRDRTRQILCELAALDPRIRVYDNPRHTVPSGLNVALSHAGGQWVARMDAHSEFPPDYIERGIARLAVGDTPWVCGPSVPVGRNRTSRAITLALAEGLGRAGSRSWGEQADEWELDTGVFCGVWARQTLLELGGWDERWRVNEDSEMASRLLARGARLVALRSMAARYLPRDTLSGLGRQYLVYGTYRVRTARRHPESLRAQHLVAPALVAAAVATVAAPRRPRRLARVALGTYCAALGQAGVRAVPAAEPRTDAALVPVVLATMHVSFGLGTWRGMRRFGVPLRAIGSLVGLVHERAADVDDVFAPSLVTSVTPVPASVPSS